MAREMALTGSVNTVNTLQVPSPHYKIQVTIISARDLMDVVGPNIRLWPYAVVSVGDSNQSNQYSTTLVDENGYTFPYWNQTFQLVSMKVDETFLHINIDHAEATNDTGTPIGTGIAIGRARLALGELDHGVELERTLNLVCTQGYWQGEVNVKVLVIPPHRRKRSTTENYSVLSRMGPSSSSFSFHPH